jgi:hypothetical protein
MITIGAQSYRPLGPAPTGTDVALWVWDAFASGADGT